jgi:hypothetical protein
VKKGGFISPTSVLLRLKYNSKSKGTFEEDILNKCITP